MTGRTLFCALAGLLLTGCATTAPKNEYTRFSQEFRDNEGFTDEHLRKLQFYICPELILERELTTSETGISSGRLIRKQGRTVNQVVIPGWTPGLVVHSADNYVAVSFEEGTALAFGVEKDRYTGDYAPLGKNTDKGFEVLYDGNWYYLIDPDQNNKQCQGQEYPEARLWIDSGSLNNVITERKVLKGRTLE